MTRKLSDAVVTIECGACSDRLQVTVDRLRSDPALQCSHCGSLVTVDYGQLHAALEHFARAYSVLCETGLIETDRWSASLAAMMTYVQNGATMDTRRRLSPHVTVH